MKQKIVKILSNSEIAPFHYRMAFLERTLAKKILPGQFIHVKINDSLEPFLRRPFSVFNYDNEKVEILYKVVGGGTKILSEKIAGGKLDIIGPLGNPFLIPREKDTINILVGGGMGIAPMYPLAKELAKKKRNLLVLIGAKTKKFLICINDFKKLKAEICITTDDGTFGKKGFISEELRKILPKLKSRAIIFTCGPNPMIEEISRIAKSYNIPCQVSLEEKMACGIGTCLGCAVLTKSGYKNVCSDGPVFDSRDIIW